MGMERSKGGMVSFGRVLDRELFLFLLDLEVKRARRYQNYLCLMLLKIKPFSKNDDEGETSAYYRILGDMLREEIRDSDIIGSLESDKLAVLLPYADDKAGSHVKSRIEDTLKNINFSGKGFEIMVHPVCFPINGADTLDLLKKALVLASS
jgi:GGDEF domain-containing protein